MKSLLFSLLFLIPLCFAQSPKTPNTIDRESNEANPIVTNIFDRILGDDLETPVQFRGTLYLDFAMWNSWAAYHPTAVDIFGRSRFRRPIEEHTSDNKNTAMILAIFRIYEASPQSYGGPSRLEAFRDILRTRGLDPENRSMDTTTAVGIGNRAGADVARLMAIDGWNEKGDIRGTPPNYRQPFADYTGYTPRNNPWKIKFPFRWQPVLENNGFGFFSRQESVIPFAGSAIAFSQTKDEMARRKVKSPFQKRSASVKTATQSDIDLLRSLAKGVLRTSKKLTEEQRIYAEMFDNKIKGFRTADNVFLPGIALAFRFVLLPPALDWDMEQDMVYALSSGIAAFDSMVASWKEKRRLDAVRPTGQTMEFLFGNSTFKVWGGPGKEDVRIKAEEWLPYIRTMPHAEFPSGSACTCSTLLENALVNTNNREDFPYKVSVPKGSSKFYPGMVPEKDFEINIEKLSDWDRLCGQSRLWAGVHFKPSIMAGKELCSGIGKDSQDFVVKLLNGVWDAKWLTWLPANVERFWEED